MESARARDLSEFSRKAGTGLRAAHGASSVQEAAMDDAQDLIDRLLTLAGMIMEDASAIALVIENGGDRTARIGTTAQAAKDVSALTMAAEVTLRRLRPC